MEKINIGEVSIQIQGDGLRIEESSNSARGLSINSANLPKIIEFLNSFAKDNVELRTGFRIPIEALSSKVQKDILFGIEHDGKFVKLAAIDLSLTGALVAEPPWKEEAGASKSVAIKHQNKAVKLAAKVVRCGQGQMALHFPESLVDGELDPPENWLTIYRALEFVWLRERVAND